MESLAAALAVLQVPLGQQHHRRVLSRQKVGHPCSNGVNSLSTGRDHAPADGGNVHTHRADGLRKRPLNGMTPIIQICMFSDQSLANTGPICDIASSAMKVWNRVLLHGAGNVWPPRRIPHPPMLSENVGVIWLARLSRAASGLACQRSESSRWPAGTGCGCGADVACVSADMAASAGHASLRKSRGVPSEERVVPGHIPIAAWGVRSDPSKFSEYFLASFYRNQKSD